MFAVTGATGQLGQRVIAHLVESVPPEQIVAIVRDPAKAAGLLPAGVIIRQAAYDEPAQLSAALQGVTRLLLISSSESGQRVGQHGNVISAAAAAGVAPAPAPCGSAATVKEVDFLLPGCLTTPRHLPFHSITKTQQEDNNKK